MILFNSILLTAHLARFESVFPNVGKLSAFHPTLVSLLYCQYGHTQHYKFSYFIFSCCVIVRIYWGYSSQLSLCIRIIWKL